MVIGLLIIIKFKLTDIIIKLNFVKYQKKSPFLRSRLPIILNLLLLVIS